VAAKLCRYVDVAVFSVTRVSYYDEVELLLFLSDFSLTKSSCYRDLTKVLEFQTKTAQLCTDQDQNVYIYHLQEEW